MPEPCECPSLDSCQKRFLWAHKELDLALHSVVGLALGVGDAVFSHICLGSLNVLSESASRVDPQHTAREEGADDKTFEKLKIELACEAEGVASPDPDQKF